MSYWFQKSVLIACTTLSMISVPLAASAECKMGMFGGRVCTNDAKPNPPKSSNVSNDKHFKYTSHRPRPKPHFPTVIETNGRDTFVFDPQQVAWAAYDADGRLIKMGPASGGKAWCADIGRPCRTPAGQYTVYRKGSASCKSSKYPIGKGGAPMPYCMFFHGGYAIHGSGHVPTYNASHGCVRVLPLHAKWLSQNFIKNGTQVIVLPYN